MAKEGTPPGAAPRAAGSRTTKPELGADRGERAGRELGSCLDTPTWPRLQAGRESIFQRGYPYVLGQGARGGWDGVCTRTGVEGQGFPTPAPTSIPNSNMLSPREQGPGCGHCVYKQTQCWTNRTKCRGVPLTALSSTQGKTTGHPGSVPEPGYQGKSWLTGPLKRAKWGQETPSGAGG